MKFNTLFVLFVAAGLVCTVGSLGCGQGKKTPNQSASAGKTDAESTDTKAGDPKAPGAKSPESQPVAAKSSDGKTVEAKPADSNSAQAKPADGKPTESKPAVTKPAESKTTAADATPQAPQPVPSAAADDPTAPIRKSADQFVKSFNAGDAKAVAALWTPDGDYVDENGQRFVGRAAIEKEYAEFFKAHPNVKIQVTIDSIRMLGSGTAIEDGRAVLSPSPKGGSPGYSRYTAVHLKQDGKWLMASVRDTRVDLPSSHAQLSDLEPLVGTWTAEEFDASVEVTGRWIAEKSYLERTVTVKQDGVVTQTSTEIVGWYPLRGQIVSWTFQSGGGFAGGHWTGQENGWVIETDGTTADGVPTTAINVLGLGADGALVWQSIERTKGGVDLPDTPEIVLRPKK